MRSSGRRQAASLFVGFSSWKQTSRFCSRFSSLEERSIVSQLKECQDAWTLRRLHASLVHRESGLDRFSANLLIQGYGRLGCVQESKTLFDELHRRNVFSWNSLLLALCRDEELRGARSLLQRMPCWDEVSWNTLIAAYAGRGHLQLAQEAFEKMPVKGVIAGTALVSALSRGSQLQAAKSTFVSMHQRNAVSWTALLMAYAETGDADGAAAAFDKMPQRDVVAWNCMLRAYASTSRRLQQAKRAFDAMPSRNVVSWATMITAYAANGQVEVAGEVFCRMALHNLVACTAVFTARTQAGDCRAGMCSSSLDDDIVSWTAMVAACAQNGRVEACFAGVRWMCLEGSLPNEVTCMVVLSACSHAGLVERCRHEFLSMQADFGIGAGCGHYECMLDSLGRSGHLEVAQHLARDMPFEPDPLTLLAACKLHSDAAPAREVSTWVLDGGNPAAYCLLSNACSNA